MNEKIMEELQKISEEEKIYLQGQELVEKSIYTEKEQFEIDSEKFLKENRFVTVRRHRRFVEFPEHAFAVYHGVSVPLSFTGQGGFA